MRREDDCGPPGVAEARFAELYREHARDVLAYAVRRTASAEDAADVVAETFLVAWRRTGEVPSGQATRLWLYGVARRTLANQRRGERRRTRLSARLCAELPAVLAAARPATTAADHEVLAAIATLRESDREVLLLSAWEQLSPAEVASVLAISPLAVRSRLYRARRRVAAMATAKHWPVLREMSKSGDYPEVVEEFAAAMRKGTWYGRPLEGDADEGLGCASRGVKLTGG